MGYLGPVQFSRFGRGGARPVALDIVATVTPASTSAVFSQPPPPRRTLASRVAKLARKYLRKTSTPPTAESKNASLLSSSSHVESNSNPVEEPDLDNRCQNLRRSAHSTADSFFSAASDAQGMTGAKTQSSTLLSPPSGTEGDEHSAMEALLHDVSRLELYDLPTGPPPPGKLLVVAHTHVHHLEHGEETGAGVKFQLIGTLSGSSEDTVVCAAIALPYGKNLSTFPRQVVLKMRSKVAMTDAAATDKPLGAASYAAAMFELRSMRKLAVTEAVFNNQALAIFQDKDWLYTASRWYSCSLSQYINGLNRKRGLSGELYHLGKYRKMHSLHFRFYAAELLDAMEELKRRNIVHCDIKSDNIFVTPSGHLILADFDVSHPNISNALGEGKAYEDIPLDRTGGTCEYMAPEMLEWNTEPDRSSRGLPTPTPRADMWSLGITLLEFALQLNEPYFHLLAPEVFTSREFGTQARALHEYLSYVWSMSGEDRGQGGEEMIRKLKEQLDFSVYAFLCGLLEMDPSKRLTVEEAKKDYMFMLLDWKKLRTGEYETPPLFKAYGPPTSAFITTGPICTELLQPRESDVDEIDVDKIVPFHTYGLDWIAPHILRGAESSGPEHGKITDFRCRWG